MNVIKSWINLLRWVVPENLLSAEKRTMLNTTGNYFRWKPGTTEWSDTRLTDGGKPTSGEDSDSSGFRVPSGLKLAASGRTVYVGKEDGELFQSFDEGDTWNDVTANLPFPVSHFKIIAFAGSTLYVATDKGVIYSRDGTDWHETAGRGWRSAGYRQIRDGWHDGIRYFRHPRASSTTRVSIEKGR